MRKVLVFILHLQTAWTASCMAQSISLSSVPFDDYNFANMKVIGQDTGGFFLLQSNLPMELSRDRVGFRNRKYKIAYYNFNLAPVWNKPVEPSPEQASVETVTFAQQKILVTSAAFLKSENALKIYCRWINNKGAEIKNQSAGTFHLSGNDHDKLKIVVSANQLLIGILVTDYIHENLQIQHLIITDSSFSLIKEKSLQIPYGEKKFSTEEIALSDNGDFCLIGIRSMKIDGSKRRRSEDFLMYSCTVADTSFRQHVLGDSSIEVTSASISFDNLNSRLLCSGFYADNKTSTGAGIVYGYIEMKKPDKFHFFSTSIDNQTQMKILGERFRGHDIGIINYPIQKLILRNDGGVVLIAEAFYSTDYSYYDYFSQSYTRSIEYHYNNIVAVSINSDGSIHWLNVIRKNQTSTDDGGSFSSFCPVVTDKSFIMIYNSDISRSSDIITATVSANGEQNETSAIKTSNNLLLYSRSGKQISENEVIVPCISRKKLMLAKITF